MATTTLQRPPQIPSLGAEPTPAQIEDVARKVAADTAADDHTAARRRIAAAFVWAQDPEIARIERELAGIAAAEDVLGRLPAWVGPRRGQLTDQLLERVAVHVGEHTARQLRSKL